MVEFQTAGGVLRAVDGLDMDVDEGDVLAIVGESGSGKSVSMLATMGLLPWTASVRADELTFDDTDLRQLFGKNRRRLIGREMSMIFQEPMSSLNPCFTVGFQIKEVLRQHLGLDRQDRHRRATELLEMVGIPAPEKRLYCLSTSTVRRDEPARDDRHGHRLPAAPADR